MPKWISGALSAAFVASAMAATPALAAPQQDIKPGRDNAPVTPARQKPALPPSPTILQQKPSMRTAAQAVAPDDENAIETASDREYAVLKLPNGLEVFLTYDPETRMSAASMSVGTGGLYDPTDKPGLSHFLEHMLFLGTEKYPKIGGYQEYLNQNGGEFNAMTGPRNTTFFFGIPNDNFEGALDRFSEFFKHPLLDPAYSAKEINAVNNEFAKNLQSDGRRANYVKDLLSNPGHPLANFGTGGNLQTLAGDNTEALKAFYHKYYSATNMKLAFISAMPLEQQAELVKKYFADVPSFNVDKPQISSDFRSPLQDQYRLLQVKSLADIRVMSLEFPTIRLVDHRDSKPESILGEILGYEGHGSLLSKLKDEGLATGLSAGGSYDDPAINTMNLTINLTQRGLENKQHVLEVVFAYIDMLKQHGVQEYTFKEQKTMGRTGIHWDQGAQGTDYVTSMSELMFDYKPKELATL
ncbi:MAG TPA: insulinase family protein, partial [Patescibacteria group bacterium]|nr:insulinase family protein [Patescibacteria group bacterium]